MIKKLLVSCVMLALVAGCSNKKKSSDEGIESSNMGGTPAIDSSAMSFDPQGSDSGTINGLKTVFFPYDKSTLDAQAKADLEGNAAWMKSNPSVKMQIEGHCDARGTIEYNVALGERRANAVKTYLKGLGIPESRMSVISYGEEKPLAQGDSDEVYAKNRRANFVPAK